MNAQASNRGFTLVEVLVALVVMAMMAALAWRGLDALMKSRDIAQTHLDQSARLATVMEQWEQDLRALQDAGIAVPGIVPIKFDGANLSFTRRQPEGMQVIVWSVHDGGFYRWAGPTVQTVAALLDSYQRSQQLQAQDSAQLRTLDGVGGWQVYFYRSNDNTWTNAQSSGNDRIPKGVRMQLQFDPATFPGPLTREIQLDPPG